MKVVDVNGIEIKEGKRVQAIENDPPYIKKNDVVTVLRFTSSGWLVFKEWDRDVYPPYKFQVF